MDSREDFHEFYTPAADHPKDPKKVHKTLGHQYTNNLSAAGVVSGSDVVWNIRLPSRDALLSPDMWIEFDLSIVLGDDHGSAIRLDDLDMFYHASMEETRDGLGYEMLRAETLGVRNKSILAACTGVSIMFDNEKVAYEPFGIVHAKAMYSSGEPKTYDTRLAPFETIWSVNHPLAPDYHYTPSRCAAGFVVGVDRDDGRLTMRICEKLRHPTLEQEQNLYGFTSVQIQLIVPSWQRIIQWPYRAGRQVTRRGDAFLKKVIMYIDNPIVSNMMLHYSVGTPNPEFALPKSMSWAFNDVRTLREPITIDQASEIRTVLNAIPDRIWIYARHARSESAGEPTNDAFLRLTSLTITLDSQCKCHQLDEEQIYRIAKKNGFIENYNHVRRAGLPLLLTHEDFTGQPTGKHHQYELRVEAIFSAVSPMPQEIVPVYPAYLTVGPSFEMSVELETPMHLGFVDSLVRTWVSDP